MSLLTQIKEQLRTFANAQGAKSLSTARVDEIAAKIATKVTEEGQIADAITLFNDYNPLSDIAKADDHARAAEAFKKKQEEAKKASESAAEGQDGKSKEGEDEAPSWFKKYVEMTDAKIDGLLKEKVISSRESRLAELLKDAPESYRTKQLKAFKKMQFASDEDFEAHLEEEKADYANFAQELDNSKLGKDRPHGGVGGVGLKDDEVSPAVKALVAEREKVSQAAKQN